MGDGTQLDITTLLIGLAVIVVSVSLAQLCLLGISAYLKNKERRARADRSDEEGIL